MTYKWFSAKFGTGKFDKSRFNAIINRYSIDTLLKGMAPIPVNYNMDALLQFLGSWISQIHNWSETVEYYNIEADCSLNGGEIELLIEVSNESDMSYILDSKTIDLSDGNQTIDISDLDNSIYARYTVTIKTIINGVTPQLHELSLNVGGDLGISTISKRIELDLLTLKYTEITQKLDTLIENPSISLNTLFDAIAGSFEASYSKELLTNIILENPNITNEELIDTLLKKLVSEAYQHDTFIKSISNLRSYLTDIIVQKSGIDNVMFDTYLELLSQNNISIDSLLEKLNVSQHIVDTLLSKLLLSKQYSYDTILGLIPSVDILFDVISEKTNIPKSYLFDTYTSSGSITKEYKLDALISKFNITKELMVDTILELINRKHIDIDTVLVGLNYKSQFLYDSLLMSSDISKSYLFDTFINLSMIKEHKFDINLLKRNYLSYLFNIIVGETQNTSSMSFDTYLIVALVRAWIDYVKSTFSSLLGIDILSDSYYDITSSNEDLLSIISDTSTFSLISTDEDLLSTVTSELPLITITTCNSSPFSVTSSYEVCE